MIQRTVKTFSFLLLVFFLSCAKETTAAEEITAQETTGNLVITQVSLNNIEKQKSWMEVDNPTDKELTLETFRVSHLRTLNALPDSIIKEGGIKVGAGEYVILCADENMFQSIYGRKVKTVCVKTISRIATGGFLAITTKGADMTKGEIVRYGKAEYSSKLAGIAGEQVVSFSEEGRSYIRTIEKSEDGIVISDFIESSADPGNVNK